MALEVVRDVARLRAAVAAARRQGKSIGLVPTMGALHAGHASLLRAARVETGFVVASIFVNPQQFGPNEDFTRYPRTWDADVALCRSEGVDLIFAPSTEEVYPQGFRTFVEVTGLQDLYEGKFRPGHFRGVATVVLKLFNMVQPDIAFFGQKDAQQARIIEQMVGDLDLPITMRVCPTVREADGLAVSSRNRYLTPEQRKHASCMARALATGQKLVDAGERDAEKVRAAMLAVLQATPGVEVDYVALMHPVTLAPAPTVSWPVLALIAVRLGGTRLIDNEVLHPERPDELPPQSQSCAGL